jgi:DNA-binding response OmpR family regulator
MRAILVARDHDEREIISFILRHAGLAVALTQELQRVASNWLERPADIVIASAGESGELEDAIKSIRAVTQVPLLIISEPVSERQHCALLAAGADLVLMRPVSPRVLTQYTHALLRRVGAIPAFVLPQIDLEGVELNPGTRTFTIQGREPRRLTQLEFRLLYVLMTNREQVVPAEILVERVWGYTGEGNRELVRGLISRVRRKVEPNPDNPHFIETIPGVGYRFSLQSHGE